VTALLALLLTLVGGLGGVIVLVRDPVRQTVLASLFSLLLALVFFAVQAPDVALSELVIGSAAIPLMLLLAIGRLREQQAQREREERE
jgi:energy-converting hydrogenase B subunit D